jgi:hypothetical protein
MSLPANEVQGDFPLTKVIGQVSFRHFYNFLKEKAENTNDIKAKFYRFIIKKFAARPDLLEPFSDLERLKGAEDLMQLVQSVLFPLTNDEEKEMYALSIPFNLHIFHSSAAFRKTFFNKEGYLYLPKNLSVHAVQKDTTTSLLMFIMEKFYHRSITDKIEFIYPIENQESGVIKHYRISIDKRFLDITYSGDKLPEIPRDSICSRTHRILDFDKLNGNFPLHLFHIDGFAVWNVTDITEEVSLDEIKNTILHMHAVNEDETYQKLEKSIQSILQSNSIKVGLIPFLKVNDQFCLYNDATNGKSILVESMMELKGSPLDLESKFTEYAKNPQPLLVTDLNGETLKETGFLCCVSDKGIRSYAIHPIQNQEGFLGVLELSSTEPGAISYSYVVRLQQAFALLAQALDNYIHLFNDALEKIIKDKFTSLQPSVQWKFTEVAYNYYRKLNSGKKTKIEDVQFDNVYPLYGAIDIRNSSAERNTALTKDLSEQLYLIDDTLSKLQESISLPLLEEIKYKTYSHLKKIETGLTSEEEQEANSFIHYNVETTFRDIEKLSPDAKAIVELYFNRPGKVNGAATDHHHHDYEESMGMVNDALSNFLDKENKVIQQSYPVFFEKYRTDGLEYNVYIGQSISPKVPYTELYLKNLRLWQLNSMAEAARITHLLKPFLKIPLQTTQLLLIHNHPMTIKFRRDERRFDAEGAYNIRYEIIKKRIDKVRIKDSNERLTQPDKIAIVYTNAKDAEEYTEYIQFLINKNILLDDAEHFELEELQGVHGLRAIRVGVNYKELFKPQEQLVKTENPN